MVRNVTAQTGGSFFLNINAEVIFNRLDVEGSYSTQEAGVFYLWQGDVMKVYNSIFNTVLSGGQGGFASIQELSIATFQNVSVYSSTSQGDGGAIVLTDSNSTLIDCRFFNTSTLTGMGGAVFSYIASHPNRPNTLAVINSTINTASTTETGGCLAVAYGGQLVLQDSSLINCVATSGGAIGLIGTDPVSRCNLTFAGINWIEGTTANNGGALYVKGTGVITFLPGGSTTSIASNASANGGFIFLGGQTSLIINHPVYFGGNVAELGSAFYIVQGMDLTISHPQDNLRGSGDFFVVNLPFALSFQQHPAYSFLSSELDMKSEPMYLRTSNQNWTTPLQSIGLSSLIPWFAVEAIDAFGNVADTNLAAPVIMVIRATNGSSWVNSNSNLTVPLSGETTKAILTSSKLVNFTDLAIQSGIGNYSIIAALISGIVPINGVESWPLFNVTVDHVCEAGYGMVASGISQNCVLCSKGTYSIAATKQPCLACPDGAVCLGGSGIKAMAGYYQSMDSRGQPYFQLCPLPQSCCVSGGCARSDSDVCSANMAGFLCADCVASSYYWGYKCVPYNPEESIHYAVYIVLGSIGYIICTILVPPKPLRWINDIWFFLQACSLMSYGSDDWMTYLHIFRFDLDFPASAALVPLSGSLKGMFKYTWVALLLGLVVFLNLFVQVVDVLVPGIATTPRFWCHGRSIKSALRWSTLHLVEISFVPLIAMSLWIVNCVSVTLPNGNRSLFMRSSPSEQCFTGSHVTASAIAITVLAITIIVYPLLIWFIGRTSMRLRLQQAGAQASFTNAASFLDLIYYMFFSELRAKHAWIFVYSHFTRAILITIASTATSNAYQTSVILFINSFVLLVPYVVLSPFAVSTRNLLKEAILMSLCAVGLLRSCSSIIQFYAQNLEDLDDFLSMFSVDNIQIFVLIFMAAPFCTLFSIQFLDSRAGKALVAKLKAGQDDRSDEHSISKSGVGRRLDDIDKDRCNLKDPKKATSLDVPALTAHAETIERRLSTRKIKIRDADPRRRSE
ncbi:uncharacterized protein BJ171DRAFT_307341 [Polychytrium aggregatum]|uniref:uncharacterized protein n=1 Tax=Polychytrium aggregatum TaxID=110093 RepID=UPI0022FE4AA4|nr:uncharacterized protein BJ171DRAFT_307341 [Polychytrium aggregatum]KAI9206822.1 hypothetical protein BJ171DRAFT_307341 [Polychytrium aggregatum]